MIQNQDGARDRRARPALEAVPGPWRERVGDMLDTWDSLEPRNRLLTRYYRMKNEMKSLGISIPPQLESVNSVVGWCAKAVRAHSVRSTFEGYVLADGGTDPDLDDLARANSLSAAYKGLVTASLVHGVSAVTVMRGREGQPAAKVRAYSAHQFCALWDKDAGGVACGIVLADTDRAGAATKYVAHFPDAVLTLERAVAPDASGRGERWECEVEANPLGRPLIAVLPHDPDLDRPLGHSLLTPELLGIVDKAMRDVLRMEIGAEFFTFPQRYALGVAEDLFSAPGEGPGCGEGPEGPRAPSPRAKWDAYVGAFLALTRDENGDVPQVGQFSPTSAENFTMTFENDAQRFSGATNVPLGQLGVLSNSYTSSDALGAANDPLILEVQAMNLRSRAFMEEVGELMLAVASGGPAAGLPERYRGLQAKMADPSAPTLAARADGWTKLGAADASIVGTRVYYEGVGLDKPTIDRLFSEKASREGRSALQGLLDLERTRAADAAGAGGATATADGGGGGGGAA